jgi:hypothetical protein
MTAMQWMGTGLLMAVMAGGVAARAQNDFTEPTPEELAMTSLPGYPGAAAVVLYRDETTKDDMHVVYHYERVKILTKDGEKYANVELPFVSTTVGSDYGAMTRRWARSLDERSTRMGR